MFLFLVFCLNHAPNPRRRLARIVRPHMGITLLHRLRRVTGKPPHLRNARAVPQRPRYGRVPKAVKALNADRPRLPVQPLDALLCHDPAQRQTILD